MKRVGFLYNHDTAHQVRHSAGVIAPLSRRPGLEVTVLATSDTLMDAVRAIVPVETRCSFVRLDLPAWHKPIVRAANLFMPAGRLDNLQAHRDRLRRFDALVVTEGTSLFLKKFGGFEHLKFIRIDHGAGDRAIGYQPSFGENDLVIVAGEKQRARFLALGYLRPDQIAVAGYVKFDAIHKGRPARFFTDDKPVVLYIPHPEAKLSSWYHMGRDVLEFFYHSTAYNLIFAPHVMLFQRRVQISPAFRTARWRRDVPEKYRHCPHMLIDMGSVLSLDMTYTRAADIYLGDVSSQVYEFLSAPRPCVFLNAHGADWRGNADYAFWNLGPVAECVENLEDALKTNHAPYRAIQEAAFRDTFSQTQTPAPVRAAAAIAECLSLT
jgi:hypothetical protein